LGEGEAAFLTFFLLALFSFLILKTELYFGGMADRGM